MIVFCTLLGMFCFSSCNSEKTNEPSEPEKAKEEIELERALQLAEEGAWGGAYLLLDDLMERGYYLDYKDKRDAIKIQCFKNRDLTDLKSFIENYKLENLPY